MTVPDLSKLVKEDALARLEGKVEQLAVYGESAPKPNKTARGPVPTPPKVSARKAARRRVKASRRANRG